MTYLQTIRQQLVTISLACGMIMVLPQSSPISAADLSVGAAKVDVTPVNFPVFVNGGMTSRSVDKAVTPLHARAVVVDDGEQRVAIVVVDSCMIGRDVLDDAKHLAATRTKIQPDHMLISATHTHTAPSSMACLGTEVQEDYVPYLREKIAEAIAQAESRLERAEAGWGLIDAADYTALRRWIIRPDRMAVDPFGNTTLRANMHAGRVWDNVTGESGPEDPDLSMIAFRARDGRPIAMLANFSMHYFSGVEALNADYFGMFCEGLQKQIVPEQDQQHPEFVAIMSHGCSGDIWRRDYTLPNQDKWVSPTIQEYTNGLIDLAFQAWQSIRYSSEGPVRMEERRLPMKYRVPDKQRLEWAQRIVAELGDNPPKTTEQVYAREQIILHERQSTEIVLQALRIGNMAIASTPNETYALTGLKIKLQSPLQHTMVIELANGGDGYIPPPEQHLLGGYNTWAARSAGLEVTAEPRIAAAAIELLESVCSAPRRTYAPGEGPAAQQIRDLKPIAWYRLDEFSGPHASDETGNGHHGVIEPAVAYFLEGPQSAEFCEKSQTNRCLHLAGNRLRAVLATPAAGHSVSLWIWNGMPADARETSGWFLSNDRDFGLSRNGLHLGVGGTATEPGCLILQHGPSTGESKVGKNPLQRWKFHHVVYVREGRQIKVYLDGNGTPEITATIDSNGPETEQWFFGGRSDNESNWEGRLDEVAVFNRALSADEAVSLFVKGRQDTATVSSRR
ncbi:MAG: hypothetical protein KDA91_21365 [Planctomycetaceae bacterium]|nr:hypothetical protein [Planctomycetaceae bacterium]